MSDMEKAIAAGLYDHLLVNKVGVVAPVGKISHERMNKAEKMEFDREHAPSLSSSLSSEMTRAVRGPRRNALCWCGSGKKRKHCHGKV